MRSTLFLAVGILLVLGIFFARDRVKQAFQVGAVLYAVVLVFRFLLFGFGDPDNFLDVAVIFAAFFVVWLLAWGGTRAILRRRERSERPPP
jgi:peptidoglycan biosynthesis protein MviN/MurJ (putative lipid II flippase)